MRWECTKIDARRDNGWEGYSYCLLIPDVFSGKGELSCGTIERKNGVISRGVRVYPAAWVKKYNRKADNVRTNDIGEAEKALCRMTREALDGVIADRKERISRAEYVIGRADSAIEQLVENRSCVSVPGDAPERVTEMLREK